jgi:hypothetical protein
LLVFEARSTFLIVGSEIDSGIEIVVFGVFVDVDAMPLKFPKIFESVPLLNCFIKNKV